MRDAAAIGVPSILAAMRLYDGELLHDHVVHPPFGSGILLYWSWLVFCVTTLAVLGLIVMSRNG